MYLPVDSSHITRCRYARAILASLSLVTKGRQEASVLSLLNLAA